MTLINLSFHKSPLFPVVTEMLFSGEVVRFTQRRSIRTQKRAFLKILQNQDWLLLAHYADSEEADPTALNGILSFLQVTEASVSDLDNDKTFGSMRTTHSDNAMSCH